MTRKAARGGEAPQGLAELERLLGHRFEETGEMPVEGWAAAFQPTDEDGNPLPSHELPLVMALEKHQAAHRAIHTNR